MTAEELRDCYVKCHRRLYHVALAVTLDRQAAEDAVHNALERLLTKHYHPDDPAAYVMRTVRNAAIDIVRKRKREGLMQQKFLAESNDISHAITPRMLDRAFLELRQSERETIFLHIYAGMTFQEIAKLRKRSINTVSAWYRRGLMKLRNVLEVSHE